MTNLASSSTSSSHALADFSFDFNGLNSQSVSEVASGNFVSRGENLFIVNGDVNVSLAMSVIAHNVEKQGLSVARLPWSAPAWPLDELLQSRAHAFTGWDREPRPFRADLLNSDLLIVEQADQWLTASPLVVLMLLCNRAEAGKSTMLQTTSSAWQHALDEGRYGAALADSDYSESSLLSQLVDSEWLRFVRRSYGAQIARRELLGSLELDTAANFPVVRKPLSRFGKTFGWNVMTMPSKQ